MGYWTLTQVPPGRKVRLGLERGDEIEIEAGPPRG
jgi:hypothetical protein